MVLAGLWALRRRAWDGQDASSKVPGLEEVVHDVVGLICGAVPDLHAQQHSLAIPSPC